METQDENLEHSNRGGATEDQAVHHIARAIADGLGMESVNRDEQHALLDAARHAFLSLSLYGFDLVFDGGKFKWVVT